MSKHYTCYFVSVHEAAVQPLLTVDEGATATEMQPTMPTTEEVDGVGLLPYSERRTVDMSTSEEVDGVGLQPYLNRVLSDLLAVDQSIPLSTESKSSTGRGPLVII